MVRPIKKLKTANGVVEKVEKAAKSEPGPRSEDVRKRKLPTKPRGRPIGPTKKLKAEPEKFKCIKRHERGPGFILALGQGDVGQLGLGEKYMERYRPARVTAIDEKIADVCAGGMHTAIVTEKGEVYTFGCNDEGALGRDTEDVGSEGDSPEFTPKTVDIDGKVVQISAGDSHTAALTDDGRVFVWGNFRDSDGPLGLISEKQQQKKPIHILPSVKITKIASGSDHLAMLSTDGHLFTCGCGEQGQLGRVAECFTGRGGRKGLDLLLSPAIVKIARTKKNGSVVFEDLWAGAYATFAKAKISGDIYACGLNNYNQLGFEDPKNYYNLQVVPYFAGKKWQQITVGMHHTLSLDSTGAVHALGRKEYGRLGLGEETNDATHPTQIPALNAAKCVDISCGSAVSYAVTDDGKLYAWGMWSNGQLGRGDDEHDLWVPGVMSGKELEGRKAIAVSSGGQHTIILVTDQENKR